MTRKATKTKLLKKIVDEVLEAPNIVDGDFGGRDESGVSLWILKKYGDNHRIYCWNFDWSEKLKGWIDNPR